MRLATVQQKAEAEAQEEAETEAEVGRESAIDSDFLKGFFAAEFGCDVIPCTGDTWQ